MGWCTFHLNQPVKEWFKSCWETTDSDSQVLDIAVVKRTQLYAAIKVISTGEVFCATYLLSWSPKSYHNFGYKDMTEHMGPYGLDECPERIFKLLTPLNDENDSSGWAREWRQRVMKLHESRKTVKTNKDAIIKLENPISFTNGGAYQFFKKIGRSFYAMVEIDGKFVQHIRVRFNPAASGYKYEFVK